MKKKWEKRRTWEETDSNKPLSHVRVEKSGAAGTKGFHESCSLPQFVSHTVRKISKTQYSISSVLSMRLWTSSSTIACISVRFGVPAAPQLRRGRRGLFTKATSCRRLGLCASPPLALPVASRQPDISSPQSFKEISVQESGRRVIATRVSDFADWHDLIVTPPDESQPGER